MNKLKIFGVLITIAIVCIVAVSVYKLSTADIVGLGLSDIEQTEAGEKKQAVVHFIYYSNFPKKILSSFTEQYPNIKVEYEKFGKEQYPEVQRVRLSSAENVDLMEVMGNDYEAFAIDGYLENLTDRTFIKNYNEASIRALSELRGDGKIFSVPYKNSVTGIWYNKILFNKYYLEVPENYEEFLEACRVLRTNGVAPMVIGCKDETVSSYIYYMRLWNCAGSDSRWPEKLESGRTRWTDEGIRKSFKEIQSFIDKGNLLKDSANLTYQQAFHEFIRGRAAMCLLDDGSLDMIEPGVEKVCDLGVLPIPYNDGTGERFVPGTRTGFLMSIFSGSSNKKETEMLLEYLSRPEVAQVYANETKSNSTVKNVNHSGIKYSELWEPLRQSEYIPALSEYLSYDTQKKLNRSARELLTGLKSPDEILQELDGLKP